MKGRLLVVDTSQVQATVCLVTDGQLVASTTGSIEVAHSEGLLPLIDRLLQKSGVKPRELAGLGVGLGPGSFTGIRIGCATIKALAQVLGKGVIGFSSLRALALSADKDGAAVAIVNAYQGQVFVGCTEPSGRWLEDAVSAAEWVAKQTAEGPSRARVLFCGDAAERNWTEFSRIAGAVRSAVTHVTGEGLALAVLEGGRLQPPHQIAANYLRPSQAEAKLSLLANTKGAC